MTPLILEILGGVALIALSAIAPFAVKALRLLADVLERQGWLTDQQRLGNAAARIAARLAADVANTPGVEAVTEDMMQRATVALGIEFRETVVRRGMGPASLDALVRGELAKLGISPR